jgi:transcriptional regulator with XRE-family HTH domain
VENSKDIEISKVTLGELIRKARKEKHKKTGIKYTQKMLANDIGVSRGYIGDIETGRVYPGFKNLKKIAEACGVSLSFFERTEYDEERIYYNEPAIYEKLPDDLKEFVANEKNTPYLIVAKQLSAYDLSKITEREMQFLIDWLKMAIEKRNTD